MSADIILLNGKIVTVDPNETIAEAVAARDGRILAVGSNAQVESCTDSKTQVIDLAGRTVVPGFIESHCHMVSDAALQRAFDVIDASYEAGVKSIVDIKSRIQEQTKRKTRGEWINVVQEDDSKLLEKRHPSRWDLDEVAREHPVIVDTVGGHFAVVNSKALEMAGVGKESPDPMGGRFERAPDTKELTGWVHEHARMMVQPVAYGRNPTLAEAMKGTRSIAQDYLKAGITCVNDGGIRQGILIRALQELLARNELPLRMRLDVRHELMPHLIAAGIAEGFGNDMLKICAIKITADGAISARTAAVSESYLHRSDYYGELAITKELLHEIIMKGYSEMYRFAVHANGERAIEMFLDAIEEAQDKYPRKDPRNRIIHCTVINKEIIKRIEKLGLLPTIFGPYPYYHGDKILPAFGEERLQRMFAARSMLDAGIRVSAHSDHPASPYPPLMGIHALVNRRTAKGIPIGESQRISVMEALKLYTINAAYHTFEENVIGSIEPGKFADMTILTDDILTVPTEDIMKTRVDATILNGRIVYERKH